MSMYETRSNRSILRLPTEVFHLIFDYLDVQTIFNSIAPVCQIIGDKVNSYNRVKLHFSHISSSEWNSLEQIIQPKNVISISLSVKDKEDLSDVNSFFPFFEFDRFVRLKSIEIKGWKFDEFFDQIVRHQFKSLSIIFLPQSTDQIHRTITQISSMISPMGLENVDLRISNKTFFDEIVLKSISIVLKRLKIIDCTYEQYHLILSSCVNLKTLNIDRFTGPKTLETPSQPFPCSTYLQLSSLMLKSYSFEFDQLFSLLSFTPSLLYLQLNIEQCQSPDILSGDVWENFIENRLSHLKIFRFSFTHYISFNSTIPSLRAILNSFETSFWFNENYRMVICDYVLRSSQINLYTRSMTINDNQIVIRSTSSTDHYQLIKRNQTNRCESLFNEQVREFF